jgi:transcriptional regulator with GAF, ATPase, and Fis domain
VARGDGVSIVREARVLAIVGRRWGPRLIGAGWLEGATDAFGISLARGAPWMASTWTEGAPLDPTGGSSTTELAAVVAHGVGRGLAELHGAGVRHGDVKPRNIVVGGGVPTSDRADDRRATLVDLDLAADVADGVLLGATARYLAPELRAGEVATPAADLYAFGLVLAELLFPEIAGAGSIDPPALEAALAKVDPASSLGREVKAWIASLVARMPGARASAAWVAGRAARALGLRPEEEDRVADRRAQVRRAYLSARSPRSVDAVAPPLIDEAIRGAPRSWLDEAHVLASDEPRAAAARVTPLEGFGISRWLVSLVGPIAASWPVHAETEDVLAERLLSLAEVAAPEAWTLDDVAGRSRRDRTAASSGAPRGASDAATWVELTRALASPRLDPILVDRAEDEVTRGAAPAALAVDLAAALLRRGDVGRAFAVISTVDDASGASESTLLAAEIARRRGDVVVAAELARRLVSSAEGPLRDAARALSARLAWDAGDLERANAELGSAGGPQAAEVRALLAYARGEHEVGLAALEGAASMSDGGLGLARLEGSRGMLEHARGRAQRSVEAFTRAVDLATRAGAVLEEATYLTGLAAAGVDAGAVAPALAAATRGALLWERLGRPSLAARAHLSRAAAFALVGASHEADLAADEARRQALASGDARAAAFARWAIVETRPPGDDRARAEALAAADELSASTPEDRVRAAARVLVWAGEGDRAGHADVPAGDTLAPSLSAAARWEWWGAQAVAGPASERSHVFSELVRLLHVPAPASSRGPALAAAARIGRELGDGDAVRRIEAARRALALVVQENAPPEHRAALRDVAWLEGVAEEDARGAMPAAQVGELEAIVRALSSRDRLKPLLAQVVDTMVLWTGVERGLLLLRAPDGRLVPRAARNLARQDLAGEQLALSTGLARRAMSEREAICATDAFAQVGDLHASVHALGLRSVLAVPLVARGDVLGVVYLDDRVRRGAFGPGELAWVRLVASQAALAIADARDQALLRRAVRRAERANARLAAELGAREVELATMRAELASAGGETRFPYDEIAGRSEAIRAMLRLVDRVTTSEVPVLLAGESGTGKELVARAIHKNGPRGARPFVSENCGSVPETLLESTLFGHVRGAFTGASATRAGLFDVADGGTLFLDEIGEMPLAMQTKLLRVLQNGEVRAVGGERSRTVDVRIIGATHRDLEAMVSAGTFREDLFYRLNVVGIRVPPLRERREDIPLLVSRFVEKYAATKVKVTRAAMERLTVFPWPGNVRQLENEVRRALVLADDRIDVADLSEEVARGGPAAAREAGLGLKARVDALETQLVRDALQKTSGNQTRAAEVLGVSRFGLQKMMRRLGIRGAGQ